MSDNEQSDGLEDLQNLMEEYKQVEDDGNENEQKVKIEKEENADVQMEKVIFGDKAGLLNNLARAVEKKDKVSGEITSKAQQGKKRKPAWTDADDEDLQVGQVKIDTKRTGQRDYLSKEKTYKDFLTQRFERVTGAQPKWASLEQKRSNEDIDSGDDELLRTVGFLEKPSRSILVPNKLEYKHMGSLNKTTGMFEGEIISVQFHPKSTAALIAGNSGYATIYAVDGRKNEKLHSIHIKNFKTKRVRITPCGTKAIFGTFKRSYYSYDLMTAKETCLKLPLERCSLKCFELSACGRYMAVAGDSGELHVFNVNSNELIYSFKQEDEVSGISFTEDSKRIICNSKGSNVTIFSMQMRRIEHSFIDDGCIVGNALDLSPNQRLLATGSREGIVNVYDFESVLTTKAPTPIKCFLNLRTGISDVKFNHSSELLAMSSNDVDNAVRLGHFPSGTVYSNFPVFHASLGKINTVQFSPNSGYLALGSRNKTVPFYRLKHFSNY